MASDIPAFLSLKRIAVVGVSHDPKHFSRAVYRAWRDRGYDLVPVNPAATEIEGAPCHATPRDIAPPVEAALVMTPAAVSEQVVKDCHAAGIRRIWLYRRSPAAELFCAKHDIDFITGECPMMFLPNNAWPHRLHRWLHSIAS
jgi:uncharacterized protein